MNNYVVAIFNQYEGTIEQVLVKAENKFDALFQAVEWTPEDLGPISTFEQLGEELFNQEQYVNVLEIE
jgi:hypothetical protein